MRRTLIRSPVSSCKKPPAALRLRYREISVSLSFLRLLSKEVWLKSCKPARKPRLIPVMKKRLNFARRHRHWTLAQLKKVLFQINRPYNNIEYIVHGSKNGLLYKLFNLLWSVIVDEYDVSTRQRRALFTDWCHVLAQISDTRDTICLPSTTKLSRRNRSWNCLETAEI